MVSTCRIVCLSAFKKSNSSLLSFCDNANILHTCYFHNFRQAWLWPVKTIMLAYRKRWCLSSCKKSYLSLTLFRNITKIFLSCYFGYFWHNLPYPRSEIALTCRKLWCLSANKKSTWSLNFCYRYYTLKNPAVWLTKNILGNSSRTRILPDMGFAIESQESKKLSFCIVSRKKNAKSFKRNAKYHIFGPIGLRHFLVPKLHAKNQKKIMSQFSTNDRTNTVEIIRTYPVKAVGPKSYIFGI